jgi:hypothetical protein
MKLGTKCLAVFVFKRYSLISWVDNNPWTRTLASATSDRANAVMKGLQLMDGSAVNIGPLQARWCEITHHAVLHS